MLPRSSLVGKILCSVEATQLMPSRGVRIKKVNHCYTPVCDAKIVEPKKDSLELCKAGRFLVEQHFPFEPILFANQIVPTQTLVQYYQGAANEGKLLYSIVEGKEGFEKLGLVIGHRLSPTSFRDLKVVANRVKHKPTRNYMTLLAELEKKLDVMALFNAKKVLSIDVVTTMEDFRRRGVSKQLIDAIVTAACKEEYELVRLTTGSEYAAKAAAASGFVPAYQGAPEALRDEKGEALVPIPMCLPHKILRIMVKDLRLKQR